MSGYPKQIFEYLRKASGFREVGTVMFIGITAQTSVVQEEKEGKIGQLWGEFIKQGMMMQIPNVVS